MWASAPTGVIGGGTKPGAWRAINDRPYGGAWDEFRITAAHPKNVRHSERNEVESKNLLRSEKESRSNPPAQCAHWAPPFTQGGHEGGTFTQGGHESVVQIGHLEFRIFT